MPHLLRDITVFFDHSEAGHRVLESATRFSANQSAHLIGVTAIDHWGDFPQDAFSRGKAIVDVIRHQQELEASRLTLINESLETMSSRFGVSTEFRVIPAAEAIQETSLHALYSDLLIIGHPNAPGTPASWSLEDVLMRAGVPLMIVPDAWRKDQIGRRITVAWNASRQSRRALADSLPLLVSADVVQLLIVDSADKADLHGEEPGADMATYLARHDVKVELKRVPSDGQPVAMKIVEQALDFGSDLLVFGAYSRPKIREMMLGGVTKTLLSTVPMPLFVSY
ncbi:universal stress protein [Herbaspirillum camelliae]|uniref:universal stress protein n=1 Tax=Herbaspirillum camelliae TaxID=1892903 RepID=UPI000949E84F|nr:universal stress protein [Herbaspirillum camelliae]